MATNPLQYNWEDIASDPVSYSAVRRLLEQAGLLPAGGESFRGQEGYWTDQGLAGSGLEVGTVGGGYDTGLPRFDALRDGGGNVLAEQEIAPYGTGLMDRFAEGMVTAGPLMAAGSIAMNPAFGGLGGAAGSVPLTAAEMGVGQFPAGMEGWGFMPASGAAEAAGTAAGGYGGMTGGGLLTGNAGAGLGGAAGFGGLGEAGGVMASLGGASAAPSFLSALGTPNALANLGSAAIGLYGQNKAIGAMKDATGQAQDFNRYAFDTIRADNKPLVDMRNSVLPQIQGLLANPSSVMNDPGNQFQFDQGVKARANAAAGQGMTYSGAQQKALTRFGQDFASTKLDDSLRRLQSVAGLGQVGSNSNNAATANFAGNAAGNALNMGNARGSVYGNMANIGGNALSNIFNPWQWDQVNGRGG